MRDSREILLDMLQQAASGKNPGPSHGEKRREFTAQDVPVLSARIVAKKKLATEAAKASAVANAAVTEATLTMANAKHIADEAAAEEANLRDELRLGISRGLEALENAPSRGGLNAGAPIGAAGDVQAGDSLTLPAQRDPANTLRPIIRQPDVNIAQPGGQAGEPQLGQGDQAKIAVEAERVRALRQHEATMEARAREEIKYDANYDFSFLSICRLGEYQINSNPTDNNFINTPAQARDSVDKSKATAATLIYPGQRRSEHSRSSRARTERGLLPTIQEEVSTNNTNHISLTTYS